MGIVPAKMPETARPKTWAVVFNIVVAITVLWKAKTSLQLAEMTLFMYS